MKLVWHADLQERDWFRWLLAEMVTEEITDLDLRYVGDDAIHVVNSNHHPLRAQGDYFERLRRESANITLLHASDEFFSGGYGMYRHFDRVLRTYDSWLTRSPGIYTFPLGYPNGMAGPDMVTPASARGSLWFFAGGVKASRVEMVRALEGIEPHLLVDTAKSGTVPLDRAGYLVAMDGSAFIPCPMGNVVIETWRFFEALERGCIPLVERRMTMDYYRRALGANPAPAFRSWKTAARHVARLAADPATLDAAQAAVHGWWGDEKAAQRRRITAFLRGPSHNAALQRYAARMRNRSAPVHEALRLAELVRHQSAGSLVKWLGKMGKILKRARKESF